MHWTAAEHGIRSACARLAAWAAWLPNGTAAGPPLARLAAMLYLAGLAILAMTAWHDPAAAASGLMGALPGWHLAFLMATGTGVAVLTLTRPETGAGEPPESERSTTSTAGLSELMAQMSHELRTPLNAVIGFSELMLHELHGPLGNARYQEYAHHISESGGRLLKSSEEALAVTEAMTALMADRGGARRERRIAATLLRDAWREATSTIARARRRVWFSPPAPPATSRASSARPCRRSSTSSCEALGRGPADGAVTVTGRRQGGRRSLEIAVETGVRSARELTLAPACASSSPACCSRCRARPSSARRAARPGWPGSSSRAGGSASALYFAGWTGSPACWSGSSSRLRPGGRRCSRQSGKACRSSRRQAVGDLDEEVLHRGPGAVLRLGLPRLGGEELRAVERLGDERLDGLLARGAHLAPEGPDVAALLARSDPRCCLRRSGGSVLA